MAKTMAEINAIVVCPRYTKYAVTPAAVMTSRAVQVQNHRSFSFTALST
ncbi:MAG: hypothetical protein AB1299_04610 [Thermoproteota archaeon]